MWNKVAAFMILITASSLLIMPFDIDARGGRGGGGGGRGGGGGAARGGGSRGGSSAYRGGHTMNRTPSMSRATNRPAAPRQQSSTLQQARVQQQPRQGIQQRPSAANRTDLRNQVNNYAQSKPTQNIDRQAMAQKAQNFSSNRNTQMAQNRQLSNQATQRLQQLRPDSNQWFDRNFFDRHDINVDYARTGANLWRPAAWATLATWGAWNWSTPYYYDYGGEYYPITTIDYSYNTSTAPSMPVQTQIPASPQVSDTNQEEWLPLGVFAVASDPNSAALTNRFIQLAVNRNGEIAGVLYNSLTDDAFDLTGTVNQENQKAYWSLANRPGAPVASTGLYNLTEDQTPINVHFSDGSDQKWTLVRLQQGQ